MISNLNVSFESSNSCSGMAKYWIIPGVGDKELPGVDHQLVSCSLLNYYVLMF